MIEWVFVDDSSEDRTSFARELSDGGTLRVTAISATDARDRLAAKDLDVSGILMDVDLSNESTSRQSGPGLTADIRAAQHRGELASFPIVRFSYRDRVRENIGTDPSSDQSFDLKIDKDRLMQADTASSVRKKLVGASLVHAADGSATPTALLAIDNDRWASWGSASFHDQLQASDRPHVRARWIMEALVHPGMLISEDYLAARLSVDRASPGWEVLRAALDPIRYQGVAAEQFPRWWARGLEAWWEEHFTDVPLAANSTAERIAVLQTTFAALTTLVMPKGSLGERPWRACALTAEETGEFLPLDPECAVRFMARPIIPEWLDPTYAALGPALRHQEDPRLDRGDMARLRMLARRG